MRLVLASQSPRRRALLESIGIRAEVVPSEFDEKSVNANGFEAGDLAAALAQGKVRAVAAKYPKDLILGADTIVVLDGQILGKPKNHADAIEMLERLSGRTHSVYTGLAVYEPKAESITSDYDCTYVFMDELSEDEIKWYVGTGEPMGKAGSYAIQGAAALFITKILGDYTSVIGLPIPKFYEILKKVGVDIKSLTDL